MISGSRAPSRQGACRLRPARSAVRKQRKRFLRRYQQRPTRVARRSAAPRKVRKSSTKLWLRKPKAFTFPTRLASHSLFSIQVKNDAISLPSQYPLDELSLKFVARFPGKVATFPPWGPKVATSPGAKQSPTFLADVLRHFAGIDPDVAVRFPSPGSLPLED